MSEIKIKGLNFQLGAQAILHKLNFYLGEGEVGAIIGRSGAGKSTLLKLIAGLLKPSSGQILINNQQVLPPDKRLIAGEPGVKLVSQTFDLMPFITAKENIFQGMMPLLDDEKNAIAAELIQALELSDVANKKTNQLSGGQQQRVAIARALAEKPKLLLMDEVFAQLDKSTKTKVMLNLKKHISTYKTSALFVLHDAEDAFFMADKIFVLQDGEIVQHGSPLQVYQKPVNTEAAQLFGYGNILPLQLAERFLPKQDLHKIGSDVFFRPNTFALKDLKQPFTILHTTQMPTHILYAIHFEGHTFWIEER